MYKLKVNMNGQSLNKRKRISKGQSKMDNPEKTGNIGHTRWRKIKQKHNMCWTPIYTNKVNKTRLSKERLYQVYQQDSQTILQSSRSYKFEKNINFTQIIFLTSDGDFVNCSMSSFVKVLSLTSMSSEIVTSC